MYHGPQLLQHQPGLPHSPSDLKVSKQCCSVQQTSAVFHPLSLYHSAVCSCTIHHVLQAVPRLKLLANGPATAYGSIITVADLLGYLDSQGVNSTHVWLEVQSAVFQVLDCLIQYARLCLKPSTAVQLQTEAC